MAKLKLYLFGSGGGYTVWSVVRTIREAENIARWNPWLAHDWMSEAMDRLDIYEAPYHDTYNEAAHRINSLWRSYRKHHWYNEKEFWKKGKMSYPPKEIATLYDLED